MRASLQQIGNSRGIIIPKPILAQVGLVRDVEIEVEDDAVILRKPKRATRAGWEEAGRALAASGDDRLVWPEFPNEADEDLVW